MLMIRTNRFFNHLFKANGYICNTRFQSLSDEFYFNRKFKNWMGNSNRRTHRMGTTRHVASEVVIQVLLLGRVTYFLYGLVNANDKH
jgi:hypothetical protein